MVMDHPPLVMSTLQLNNAKIEIKLNKLQNQKK